MTKDFRTFTNELNEATSGQKHYAHGERDKWESHAKRLGYKIHHSPSFPKHAKAKDKDGNDKGHFNADTGGHIIHEKCSMNESSPVAMRSKTDAQLRYIMDNEEKFGGADALHAHDELERRKKTKAQHDHNRDHEEWQDKRAHEIGFHHPRFKLKEDFVRPVSKTTNHSFGKFKKPETPGNKRFEVHLTGDVEGRHVQFSTTVSAYNREAAVAHARSEMKIKNKAVSNVTVDHVQLKEETLNEVSRKTLSSYLSKALPDAKHHTAEAEKREKKLKAKHGNLHKPDKKLQLHRRKEYNRTYGVNKAHDKLHENYHYNVTLTATHKHTNKELHHQTSVVAKDEHEAHTKAKVEMLKKHPHATYIANVHRPDGYKKAD